MLEADKAFFIKAYFDDLKGRVAFLAELFGMGKKDEALMLTCCYIEALGTRRFGHASKIRSYSRILIEHGRNDLWQLVHPRQIKAVLNSRVSLAAELPALSAAVDASGNELVDPDELVARLDPSLPSLQHKAWLRENVFRGSIAAISYERIRSELVHDISAASTLSFSTSTYKGAPVPELSFETLFVSLQVIVTTAAEASAEANKWWFEA